MQQPAATRLASVRFVLLNTLGWGLGAMFAAVWMWFLGVQLSAGQAQVVVAGFAVMGAVFGVVQVVRGRAGPAQPTPDTPRE